MSWHIASVLAAVRAALNALEALVAALNPKQSARYASLLSSLRAAETEAVALKGASSSDDDDEDTPSEAPPRP